MPHEPTDLRDMFAALLRASDCDLQLQNCAEPYLAELRAAVRRLRRESPDTRFELRYRICPDSAVPDVFRGGRVSLGKAPARNELGALQGIELDYSLVYEVVDGFGVTIWAPLETKYYIPANVDEEPDPPPHPAEIASKIHRLIRTTESDPLRREKAETTDTYEWMVASSKDRVGPNLSQIAASGRLLEFWVKLLQELGAGFLFPRKSRKE